jgi:hypothetical protein
MTNLKIKMKTRILDILKKRGFQFALAVAVMQFFASCSMQTTSMQRANNLHHEQAMVTNHTTNTNVGIDGQCQNNTLQVADVTTTSAVSQKEALKTATVIQTSQVAPLETKGHRLAMKFKDKTAMVRGQITKTVNLQMAAGNMVLAKSKVMATEKDNHSLLSHYLRLAIIFLLIGLIIGLFGGYTDLFYIIGSIFVIIGVIFLILWLLNEL